MLTSPRGRCGCVGTVWPRGSNHAIVLSGRSSGEALAKANAVMRSEPSLSWSSRDVEDWQASAGGGVPVGLSGVPAEVLAEWVAASCAGQGVPVKVADPTVVRRGALLGAEAAGRASASGAARAAPAGPLQWCLLWCPVRVQCSR